MTTGELLSGGNFHGQAVGMMADFLAIVAANLAVVSERRVDRLVHPDFNQGQPAFLAGNPGLESGQKKERGRAHMGAIAPPFH